MIKLTGLSFVDTWRWVAACGIVISYVGFCIYKYYQAKWAAQAMRGSSACDYAVAQEVSAATEQIWIVYASQTGQAEAIAQQTAQSLRAAHRQIHLCRIEEDWQAKVATACYVLFVVSTYGEGSAPDHAAKFVRAHLRPGAQTALQGLHYGLLALGDKAYPAFCAFGRQLDAWLQASGARPEFELIEVDRLDHAALLSWQRQLSLLGASEAPAWNAMAQTDYSQWRFVERQCLNPNSPGNPINLVVLQTAEQDMPQWQAGDLVDVLIPGGDGRPRAYSIANLPGSGRLELIVRKFIRDDGQIGVVSGWLTETAQTNDLLSIRIRSNPSFHVQQDLSRPLILIGAGTGIAGLRAHLQARAQAIAESGGSAPLQSAWLFFGERSGRHDYLCRFEIEAWKKSRVLTNVDMTFSRDYPVAPYVQDSLRVQSKGVREWIERGAQILICGNAKKMALDVDKTLRQMLGSKQVDLLFESGQIRRDVF